MRIAVQPERARDVAAIAAVVRRAYAGVAYSDHREHEMVARLRASAAFVPKLSLLAEVAGAPVGHVLLTRVAIRDGAHATPALALAPLSVVPEYQGQGVGRALVEAAHRRARALGFGSVVVLGPPGYYRRFGYVPLGAYPITVPLAVPAEQQVIRPLSDGALEGVRGTVAYPREWMDRA